MSLISNLAFHSTGAAMTRLFIRIVVTVAGVVAGILTANADDSLLSDVSIDSVYKSAGKISTETAVSPVRVYGLKQLAELLRDAGFDVKSAENNVVETTKPLDSWTFPVLVTISDDERQLGITLALSSIESGEQVKAEELLAMMEANLRHAPTQFLFNRTRQRTELYFLLENDRITARLLRDEINRLAVLAKENESVWELGISAKTKPKAADPKKTVPQTPAGSLTGSWSSARSAKEAFAIRFNADDSFVLVYINDGRQTRSEGKFRQDGTSLDLEGKDGKTLSGTFQWQSEKQFLFQPKNGAALTFKRAAN